MHDNYVCYKYHVYHNTYWLSRDLYMQRIEYIYVLVHFLWIYQAIIQKIVCLVLLSKLSKEARTMIPYFFPWNQIWVININYTCTCTRLNYYLINTKFFPQSTWLCFTVCSQCENCWRLIINRRTFLIRAFFPALINSERQ